MGCGNQAMAHAAITMPCAVSCKLHPGCSPTRSTRICGHRTAPRRNSFKVASEMPDHPEYSVTAGRDNSGCAASNQRKIPSHRPARNSIPRSNVCMGQRDQDRGSGQGFAPDLTCRCPTPPRGAHRRRDRGGARPGLGCRIELTSLLRSRGLAAAQLLVSQLRFRESGSMLRTRRGSRRPQRPISAGSPVRQQANARRRGRRALLKPQPQPRRRPLPRPCIPALRHEHPSPSSSRQSSSPTHSDPGNKADDDRRMDGPRGRRGHRRTGRTQWGLESGARRYRAGSGKGLFHRALGQPMDRSDQLGVDLDAMKGVGSRSCVDAGIN